jgi:hypothetical protein
LTNDKRPAGRSDRSSTIDRPTAPTASKLLASRFHASTARRAMIAQGSEPGRALYGGSSGRHMRARMHAAGVRVRPRVKTRAAGSGRRHYARHAWWWCVWWWPLLVIPVTHVQSRPAGTAAARASISKSFSRVLQDRPAGARAAPASYRVLVVCGASWNRTSWWDRIDGQLLATDVAVVTRSTWRASFSPCAFPRLAGRPGRASIAVTHMTSTSGL